MNQTLSIDGIDVHIEGEGADTLVMIHGWPDTHRLWDAQVAHFKDRYRCVRFTLPGFDISKPPKLTKFDELMAFFKHVVEATSPGRPVILMIHDWGCLFGYQFALRYPALVARVIGVDIGDAHSDEHMKKLSIKARLMVWWYQSTLARAWRIGGEKGDRMTRSMAKLMRSPGEPASIGVGMDYPYQQLRSGAYKGSMRPVELSCPLLFLYGRRKPFMFHSQAWVDAVAKRPGNQVVGFDTGHWIMAQRPKPFNEAVDAWLKAAL